MGEITVEKTTWYFVDESGDPVFFNRRGQVIVGKEGCSPILLLGFVEMSDPHPARVAIAELRKAILSDPYLKSIPSMAKTARAFHAKDDCPEVRKAVFELILKQDFEFKCVVARKEVGHFRAMYDGKPSRFYDHLRSFMERLNP